ncbi:MAG: hypothetical protein J5606_00520, partial [Bacteroidales bacterium]|nr:hypothetical protein [Bacteroidales bacterium]
MTITKSLDVAAIASATNVAIRQKVQNNAANLRPEKIVVIGQAQTGKTGQENILNLASGNADDIGVIYGFGSPLHRMAKKLFPKSGNGSKVDTYFIAVGAPNNAVAEVKTLSITGTALKSLNGYFKFTDMTFEAAADVAGKVATISHNNPALDARGTDLNVYEKTKIPFTIVKGMTAGEVAAAIKETLDEYLETPFTVALATSTANEQTVITGLTLTAKWAGSDSCFEFEITDENGDAVDATTYGVTFTQSRTSESAGVGTISETTLNLIDEELGATRVVCQYATSTVLDALQEYFEAFHDGLIAQYIVCYTAIQAPESNNVSGTWDVASLIATGTSRRNDSINVQIVGDSGNLRKLKYAERNRLLKAGYTNLVRKSDGSYRLMDLASFYHPLGNTNPLFRFDRDITVVGNIAYDIMTYFRDSDEWKSFITIGADDITTNPKARTLKDGRAAVNTRISLLGKAAM